jgi:hypothetical protein
VAGRLEKRCEKRPEAAISAWSMSHDNNSPNPKHETCFEKEFDVLEPSDFVEHPMTDESHTLVWIATYRSRLIALSEDDAKGSSSYQRKASRSD